MTILFYDNKNIVESVCLCCIYLFVYVQRKETADMGKKNEEDEK